MKENRKRLKLKSVEFNILFLLAALYVCVSLITKNTVLFYGYTLILAAYSLINFRLGLAAWVIIALITGASEQEYLSIIYTFILVFIYMSKLLYRRERLYKSNFMTYLIILTLMSFLSTLISGYWVYFHVLAIFVLIFISSNIMTQQIIKDDENIFVIGNAFIASALIATISSFITSTEHGRLGLGESIRQLSNIIGMGLILLVSLYFVKKKPVKNKAVTIQYKFVNRIKWILIIVLVAGLVSTISRGTIIATVLSIAVIILLTFFNSLRRLEIQVLFKGGVVVLALTAFILTYGVPLLEVFNFSTELLAKRFDSESVEGGAGIREEIWRAGISGLEGVQMLYGHGISSFRMLALKSGYDYYAHSIFVDTFVTVGLLGFTMFILMMLNIAVKGLRQNNIIVLALMVFLILNYMTHGSMKSTGFWYLIALSAGLVEHTNRTQKLFSRGYKINSFT